MEELDRARARVKELEAIAARTPPKAGMTTALTDHFTGIKPPVDPARAKLEATAAGFRPDAGMEDALRARAKDQAGYEAQVRAMGASPVELSLYDRQRSAAIEVGTFVPATTSGGSK